MKTRMAPAPRATLWQNSRAKRETKVPSARSQGKSFDLLDSGFRSKAIFRSLRPCYALLVNHPVPEDHPQREQQPGIRECRSGTSTDFEAAKPTAHRHIKRKCGDDENA